ncbi:hypothetical protein BV898_07660 [Hypsibius exemplaris]|uniref:Uncharacterized protein n=1 Tax=Hypsibius exemplaris TaxID=2072580 RepID=A0A1W0WSU2_HYPEX|nr:hypothetical protein BV898_07660 [Hypsibius exemplaris]
MTTKEPSVDVARVSLGILNTFLDPARAPKHEYLGLNPQWKPIAAGDRRLPPEMDTVNWFHGPDRGPEPAGLSGPDLTEPDSVDTFEDQYQRTFQGQPPQIFIPMRFRLPDLPLKFPKQRQMELDDGLGVYLPKTLLDREFKTELQEEIVRLMPSYADFKRYFGGPDPASAPPMDERDRWIVRKRYSKLCIKYKHQQQKLRQFLHRKWRDVIPDCGSKMTNTMLELSTFRRSRPDWRSYLAFVRTFANRYDFLPQLLAEPLKNAPPLPPAGKLLAYVQELNMARIDPTKCQREFAKPLLNQYKRLRMTKRIAKRKAEIAKDLADEKAAAAAAEKLRNNSKKTFGVPKRAPEILPPPPVGPKTFIQRIRESRRILADQKKLKAKLKQSGYTKKNAAVELRPIICDQSHDERKEARRLRRKDRRKTHQKATGHTSQNPFSVDITGPRRLYLDGSDDSDCSSDDDGAQQRRMDPLLNDDSNNSDADRAAAAAAPKKVKSIVNRTRALTLQEKTVVLPGKKEALWRKRERTMETKNFSKILKRSGGDDATTRTLHREGTLIKGNAPQRDSLRQKNEEKTQIRKTCSPQKPEEVKATENAVPDMSETSQATPNQPLDVSAIVQAADTYVSDNVEAVTATANQRSGMPGSVQVISKRHSDMPGQVKTTDNRLAEMSAIVLTSDNRAADMPVTVKVAKTRPSNMPGMVKATGNQTSDKAETIKASKTRHSDMLRTFKTSTNEPLNLPGIVKPGEEPVPGTVAGVAIVQTGIKQSFPSENAKHPQTDGEPFVTIPAATTHDSSDRCTPEFEQEQLIEPRLRAEFYSESAQLFTDTPDSRHIVSPLVWQLPNDPIYRHQYTRKLSNKMHQGEFPLSEEDKARLDAEPAEKRRLEEAERLRRHRESCGIKAAMEKHFVATKWEDLDTDGKKLNFVEDPESFYDPPVDYEEPEGYYDVSLTDLDVTEGMFDPEDEDGRRWLMKANNVEDVTVEASQIPHQEEPHSIKAEHGEQIEQKVEKLCERSVHVQEVDAVTSISRQPIRPDKEPSKLDQEPAGEDKHSEILRSSPTDYTKSALKFITALHPSNFTPNSSRSAQNHTDHYIRDDEIWDLVSEDIDEGDGETEGISCQAGQSGQEHHRSKWRSLRRHRKLHQDGPFRTAKPLHREPIVVTASAAAVMAADKVQTDKAHSVLTMMNKLDGILYNQGRPCRTSKSRHPDKDAKFVCTAQRKMKEEEENEQERRQHAERIHPRYYAASKRPDVTVQTVPVNGKKVHFSLKLLPLRWGHVETVRVDASVSSVESIKTDKNGRVTVVRRKKTTKRLPEFMKKWKRLLPTNRPPSL